MKMLSLIILLSTQFKDVFAEADTSWLDSKWRPVEKESAVYLSITKVQNNLWVEQLYYGATGKLFMTGSFKNANCTLKTGTFKWYYGSGSIRDSINYDNNKIRYLSHYHPNGKVKTILIYNEVNRAVYVNSWNADGSESVIDTFYHDRAGNECDKDTAFLKGIIAKDDTAWHLRFYRVDNGLLFINSWYKQRLCSTRIKDFEHYNEEGKLIDSALYYNNGKKQALWLFHNNCMISAYKTYDSSGALTGGTYWDEQGNERMLDPSIVYPSQPGGFRIWKKKVIGEINSDRSINRELIRQYYGNIQVKLLIDRDGKLTGASVRNPSVFPDMDRLILSICKKYEHWKPGTVRGIESDFVLNCNFFFNAGVVTAYQQSY